MIAYLFMGLCLFYFIFRWEGGKEIRVNPLLFNSLSKRFGDAYFKLDNGEKMGGGNRLVAYILSYPLIIIICPIANSSTYSLAIQKKEV